LAAGSAAAQSFGAVARLDPQEFRTKIADVRRNDSYAKYVVCSRIPEAAGLRNGIRFYTFLEGVGPLDFLPEEGNGAKTISLPRDVPKDEARLNDYNAQSATRTKLHIDAWSCDTQDYFLAFDMDGLVRDSQRVQSRPVRAHVHVETRGSVDFDGNIACTAFW